MKDFLYQVARLEESRSKRFCRNLREEFKEKKFKGRKWENEQLY